LNKEGLAFDFILFEDFCNVLIGIIKGAAHFGVGQGAVYPQVLQGTRAYVQKFSDFGRLQPFFFSFLKKFKCPFLLNKE